MKSLLQDSESLGMVDLDPKIEKGEKNAKNENFGSRHPTPLSFEIDDPLKWSFPKKVLVTTVMSFSVLSLTFSSSAFSSSIPQIQEELGISSTIGRLGITLFVFGFGSGSLLVAPLALTIGNRWCYIITYGFFTAFSFGAAEANTGATLIVLRFLAGFSGASCFNNGIGTITDMVTPQQVNRYGLWYGISAFGGPALGPVIAAFVSERAGWRWNLRVQAIFIASCWLGLIFFVPETSREILEQQQGKKRTKTVGQIFRERLKGPWKYLFLDPVVMVICFYLSMLYGVLYGFFGVIPYTFEVVRGFTPEQTGLTYISLVVGFVTGGLVIYFPQQWTYDRLTREAGGDFEKVSPEARFQQGLWASWVIPLGLFLFAWTAPFPSVHFIAPLIGVSLFSAGVAVVFTSCIPYLALYGVPESPVVLASATFSRSTIGATFPLFTVQMNEAMTIQGANSLLAGLALLLAPLPLLFKWKGPYLRERAKRKKQASLLSAE